MDRNRGGGRWGRPGGRWGWGWGGGRGRGVFRGKGKGRGGGNGHENGGSEQDLGPELMPPPDPVRKINPPDSDPPSGDPPKKRKRTSVKKESLQSWTKKLPGYRLYYPDGPPKLSDVDKKIQLISDYLLRKGYMNHDILTEIDEQEYFEVRCEQVLIDSKMREGWPDFLTELISKPEEVVNLWGAVMHKMISDISCPDDNEEEEKENDSGYWKDVIGKRRVENSVGRIQAGLLKIDPVTPLLKISSSHIGMLVTISGQIVNTGAIRAVCLQMPFWCKVCEQEFVVDQPHGLYTLPTRCGASEDCDNKYHFEPKETSNNILMMDCRRIKLEDIRNFQVEKGTIPKTIECELTNGLVHQCNTGDNVTITGIVKMKKEFRYNGEKGVHNFYVQAVAMKNHRESERTAGGNWFTFSDKDYCAVSAIHDHGQELFKVLVASLCPSIYGHEYIKAALMLSLFGGSPQNDDILSRRSDINVLMIGDPGIGKTQMMQIVTSIAPRGVYVCGTGSTQAGLTVTLVKDGDGYSLEAGALVLGDLGFCCIDEFDKMVPQHSALLEAMEQQSVSIAKAGVFRTLPARTTVIAAANPIGGHYDQRKSLCENIKISPPLLSRFDITFILLDKSNRDLDKRIVDHIMGLGVTKRSNTQADSGNSSTINQNRNSEIPLIERIRVGLDEDIDVIPHSLLRKYIAYARQYVKPKLDRDAVAVLKEYYLRLRISHRSKDSVPVTTRQLESLARLTEARAKLELRNVATASDAKDILEIFEASHSSAFDDEIVAVSALSQSIIVESPAGIGKSQSRNQAKRLVAALQKSAERQCKSLFTVEEIKCTIKTLGLKTPHEQLLSMLNNDGCLLKKGSRLYQLLSVDY